MMVKVLFEARLVDGLFEVGTLNLGALVQLNANDTVDAIWMVNGCEDLDDGRCLVELSCVSSKFYCPGTVLYVDSKIMVKCWSNFKKVNEGEV